MADETSGTVVGATGVEGTKPNAETVNRLSPEEHITKLNHESAEHRREAKEARERADRLEAKLAEAHEAIAGLKAQGAQGETAQQRAARLELRLKKSAVGTAVQSELKRCMAGLQDAGQSVNKDALDRLLASGSIAIDIDYTNDVLLTDDDEAIVRGTAKERIAETVKALVETVAQKTTVVAPPSPTGEPPAKRGSTPLSELMKVDNAWDKASPLSRHDKGRKTLKEAANDPAARAAIDAFRIQF